MKIIIVGCGQVGETLASQLGEEGNDITVIDLSQERVKYISSRYDVMGVVGNGATHTVQKEAGIKGADLLIAVTNSDELNLLCCLIARKNSDCKVIARVQNPEYSSESEYLKYELGLAMVINPKHAAAEEIARVLRFPAATKIEPFAKGRVELLTFRLPDRSPLVGMSVKEVSTKLKCDILICTIERDDEVHIPNGNFVFEPRDNISIIASPRKAASFFKKIEYNIGSIKNAIIAGASEITHYLCAILQKSGFHLKVIDKNAESCDKLCSDYDNVTVINGDETDLDLLVEEGVEKTDAFIALTDNDEENVLLSLSARNIGAGKLITAINKPEYHDVMKHLGLDTTVYPKDITADMIVRYVRAMRNTLGSNMETMYNIIKGKVEASEFVVGERSSIIRIPISELKLKSGVLIAAILRDRSVIIPHGQDKILPGDNVIIVSKHLAIHNITDILR